MKPSFVKTVLSTLVIATIIWGGLLLIASTILMQTENPAKYFELCANVIIYLGALFAGRLSYKYDDRELLCSALKGVVLAAAITLPMLLISEWGASSLLRIALVFLCTFIGSAARKPQSNSRNVAKKRKNIARRYS